MVTPAEPPSLDAAAEVVMLAAVTTPFEPEFDQRDRTGPFDLIGDVHGCMRELEALLVRLDYGFDGEAWNHPSGRTAVLLGDVVDRGNTVPEVIIAVSEMVRTGNALYVPGNHDERFAAFLAGGDVEVAYGLEQTVAQLGELDAQVRGEVIARFLRLYSNAPPYLWLDGGRLVAVHGGLEEDMIGRLDDDVWRFCLMGKIEVDQEHGVHRLDWADGYHGDTLVVYGHTPCPRPRFVNNTINLDQGCVFGGGLTALRYPERKTVTVRAARPYFIPGRATA